MDARLGRQLHLGDQHGFPIAANDVAKEHHGNLRHVVDEEGGGPRVVLDLDLKRQGGRGYGQDRH